MTSHTFIAPRPAPAAASGWLGWCKSNLFYDWKTSLGTVLIGLIVVYALPRLFNWGVTDAVLSGGY